MHGERGEGGMYKVNSSTIVIVTLYIIMIVVEKIETFNKIIYK